MSSFDDEFGLFGEDAEAERRSRLPARRIASKESASHDVEPESPERERRPQRRDRARRDDRPHRPRVASADPWAAPRRANELLQFLAKRLVAKPDDVKTELFIDEQGDSVIELIVDREDLGKVIGKNGRVAHALRTLARATAESPISVDILDQDEAAEPVE
jgi:predicted RNA-binding protein YlqC (UPF0109 family)